MTLLFGIGGFGFGFFSLADLLQFDDLTLYYMALLIVQYVTKPKARATVGVLVREIIAQMVDEAVRDGFDLDTAEGVQLDILASYRGALRNVFGVDLAHNFFSYALYSDVDPTTLPGYAFYSDSAVADLFLVYFQGGQPSYSMTDDELRRLTKFLAITQSRFLSLKEIDAALFAFFGNFVSLTDNGNMTITYTHNLADPDTLYNIVKDTDNLPAPAGVQLIFA